MWRGSAGKYVLTDGHMAWYNIIGIELQHGGGFSYRVDRHNKHLFHNNERLQRDVVKTSLEGVTYLRQEFLFCRIVTYSNEVFWFKPRRITMDTMQESIRVKKAARILDVSPQTLLRKVNKGLIKGFRLPGSNHVRVPIAELRRIQSGRSMNPSDDK